MFNRTLLAAGCLTVAVLTMVGCSAGSHRSSDAAYVTLEKPAQLPGITLDPGTYIFEQADAKGPGAGVVRVRSGDGAEVCFLALTDVVDRPAGMGRAVSFSPPASDGEWKIAAWYPKDKTVGHQFIYAAPPQPRVHVRGVNELSCGATRVPRNS